MNIQNQMEVLLECQKKYGQRRSDSLEAWVLRKRAINTAVMVVFSITGIDFSDFEPALYFRCDDDRIGKFIRSFDGQMEEAAIHPAEFIRNLDAFYLKTCLYIEENHLFREFFDFYELLEQRRREKIQQGHKAIFDAYLSLLMQQINYFSRRQMEYSVSGITDSGDLIFRKNPHPYSDMGAYRLEEQFPAHFTDGLELTEKQIYHAYRPYGYEIRSMYDIEALDARARVYDNNNYAMIPYINEKTSKVLIQEPYQHHVPDFPRQWKNTGFYKEKLLHRSYMLPTAGITARYSNAGEIREIYFLEQFHNDEIILLYRVSTYGNGEYSGYFHTKSQVFYSIFENTNCPEWHDQVENFILENYMILTCSYEIDKKKNFAIRQTDNLQEFHFPYQPLASYTYKQDSERHNDKIHKNRRYVKEEYQEEMRTRCGYIRSLPKYQHVSEDALQHARELGLELPEGKTFVRSHEFKVYRKRSGTD